MTAGVPRDMPDMYPWLPGSNKAILGDLGEHAVRLGSLLWYDRRGELVFADGFANGLAGYTIVTSGTGASVKVGCLHTGSSGYNARLTTGDASGNDALVDKWCTPLLNNRLGAEANFCIETEFLTIRLLISDYDTDASADWGIALRRSDNKLCYQNATEVLIAFADIPVPISTYGVNHTLKFVVNRLERTYDRVLYDDNEYSLAGIAGRVAGAASTRSVGLKVTITGNGGGNRRMLLNHLILTDNEP